MVTMLLLGGTSWVGGLVARDAVARGHEVTCLARGESGSPPDGVTFVEADRSGPAAYDAVAHRPWDVVIDVSRQPGQVRAAVAALGASARQWTFVSTGSVYADQSVALTESSPVLPALEGDEAGPDQYGEGKVACEQAVLVPDVPQQPMQVIDVGDLARWVVVASEAGFTGVVHGAGQATTVGQLIDLSADLAGHSGPRITADPDWLLARDVEPWMGPRSLPLWLPASHHGMGMMNDSHSVEMGLQRRPLVDTLTDTLDDERARGLGRPRSAGLARVDELALIDQWQASSGLGS